MQLVTVHFSPTSYYILHFRSKFLPYHIILEKPNTIVLLNYSTVLRKSWVGEILTSPNTTVEMNQLNMEHINANIYLKTYTMQSIIRV